MAIYLGLPSPAGSSDLPGSRRAALRSLFGLASNGVYMAPPVTRRAVVSYTTFPPLPHDAAVYFCCTFPGVTSARRYLASRPVKPGLSSGYRLSPRVSRGCSACSSLIRSLIIPHSLHHDKPFAQRPSPFLLASSPKGARPLPYHSTVTMKPSTLLPERV